MNAKVRWIIDLSSIYINEGVTSGKIPTQALANPLVIGSASRHRSWGTWRRKNLMKVCLICRSVMSMSLAVKKASARSEVMCDEHGVTIMTLKCSFLFEEPERRILRGYCRVISLGMHIHIYILGQGPNPRKLTSPRTGEHFPKNPCW